MFDGKPRGLRTSLTGLFVVLLCFCAAPAAFAQGPDVIVGSIPGTADWGNSGSTYAYSIATTSCNIGTADLNWIANTNDHPVIAQDMWRLKDGRFEQIGNSWLKHGFCALQNGGLCAGCGGGGGCLDHLTPGCADPYGAGLNGSQGNLGPRWQINATTGEFPYPFSAPGFSGNIMRRLQVHVDDINAAQNPGALYFVSAQYVAKDDATFGNQANNASYRRVSVGQTGSRPLSFIGGTQQEQPPIQAWQDFQPSVTLVDVMVDGLFIAGYDVVDNGNGTWSYEFAIYNMYSDQSANSFSIPLPNGVTITAAGFNQSAWHSGDVTATDDWTIDVVPGSAITWSTDDFGANANANALRWSKMFNFYFTADAPPQAGNVTLGLFKPGTVPSVDFAALVPSGNFIPAPAGLSCSQMMPTLATGVLSWSNPVAYDSIIVERDGTPIATLPGTMTAYTDSAATFGSSTYSVQGVVGVDLTAPSECTLATAPMPVSNVGCTQTDPNFTDVTVTWNNGMAYDAVRVYLDASLSATLGGAASSTTLNGLSIGLHDIEIAGVIDGTESPVVGCVIDVLEPPPLGFVFRIAGATGEYDPTSGVGTASFGLTAEESVANPGFPNELKGLSAGLSYDGSLVTATSAIEGIDLPPVSFFNSELVSGGVTIGIVVDFNNIATITVGSPTEFAAVQLDTNPAGLMGNTTGANAPLQFVDGLGSGIPVENLVVVGFDGVAPTLESGTLALSPLAGTLFSRGDTNNDATINIADAITVLDYLFSGGSATCLDALDTNDDGSNNIADGIFLLGWLFSGGPAPAAPFQTCGTDPTDDAIECDAYTGGC